MRAPFSGNAPQDLGIKGRQSTRNYQAFEGVFVNEVHQEGFEIVLFEAASALGRIRGGLFRSGIGSGGLRHRRFEAVISFERALKCCLMRGHRLGGLGSRSFW